MEVPSSFHRIYIELDESVNLVAWISMPKLSEMDHTFCDSYEEIFFLQFPLRQQKNPIVEVMVMGEENINKCKEIQCFLFFELLFQIYILVALNGFYIKK